ncbi:MAG: polyprenyl diphosphate synthase [Treponema sp.]|nr:polyprenyl diphosphate synthase [Treponema sp.]MCL2251261.1 polyprenyl diphosphate synthase [Treponema sp.]
MENIKHLGIIMDGNRRWAEKASLQRFKGHDIGAEVFVNTCDWCIKEKIEYLTVYAFSTENWKRTKEEIVHIFKLLEKFFTEKIDLCIERGIKIKVIGERDNLAKKDILIIENAEKQTEICKNLKVQIALSYGGRNEIIRAVKKIAGDVLSTKILIKNIDEDIFEQYLDTAGIPDVDLVIRTGGAENRRLSNFLPWQTVYSELYFSEILWPDFSKDEFDKALTYYHSVPHKAGK